MRRVLLLATGDTIAFRHHYGPPSVASGAELVAALGSVTLSVEVVAEDVIAEPSWDTSEATQNALARRVRGAILDGGFDGVVVTHGVDTIVETAFLTDLLAGRAASRGAIVFTGSVRCLDDPLGDGPADLDAAIRAAADPALRGIGAVLCLGEELHAARWARLTDVTRRSALSSAPHPTLGRVSGDEVVVRAAPPVRPPRAVDVENKPAVEVALIKAYPGMPPTLLDAVVEAGARGVVLEGTGLGNVPVELFATINGLTSAGVPVVVASRAVTTDLVPDLDCAVGMAAQMGAIHARGLAPEQARIAVSVVLRGGGDVADVRGWFDRI